MTGAGEETVALTFRPASGAPPGGQARAVVLGDEACTAECLTARSIRLEDGGRLRQVLVAGGPRRAVGYERLDNEILAGRRLHAVAGTAGYPAAVSRLYGDEAESAAPYALLDPYLGQPLATVAGRMTREEQQAFEVSLLIGLSWLEAAGIAHRGLTPSTVRWDGRTSQAQITDFSLCTVFGVPRTPAGDPEWAALEQRPGGEVTGVVSQHDDMYGAGRLIYYARTQNTKLIDRGLLGPADLEHLNSLFGPPDGRLSATDLLKALRVAGPAPARTGFPSLAEGHKRFDAARRGKHPHLAVPEVPPAPPAGGQAVRTAVVTGPADSAGSAGSAGGKGRRGLWRRGGGS